MTLYFHSNDTALAPIDKAKPQALIAAGGNIRRYQPIDGVERYRVLWIDAGRHRGAVRLHTPIFDQKHLVAVDGDGLALADDQCPRRQWPCLPIPKQPKVAHESARVTQWNYEGFPGPG